MAPGRSFLSRSRGWLSSTEERRKRNVQGLSAGILVASATILAFTPMEWIILRPYFITMQGLRVLWIAALAGVWIALRRKPLWAARAIDDLVFALFLFVCLFNCILAWLHGAYDSPYTLTLLFILIGVNFFISWTPSPRGCVWGLRLRRIPPSDGTRTGPRR